MMIDVFIFRFECSNFIIVILKDYVDCIVFFFYWYGFIEYRFYFVRCCIGGNINIMYRLLYDVIMY